MSKKKFAAMKFNIGKDNEKLSEFIQLQLFSMGYRWGIGGETVQYTWSRYLFTCVEGRLVFDGEGSERFDSSEAVEIELRTLKMYYAYGGS